MKPIEKFEVGNKTVEIFHDEDAPNPRKDYDHEDTMVCFHNRYVLGDKHDYKSSDFMGWNDLRNIICKDNDVCVILPLYMYDHSGITISTSPFDCPWDSGQIGYIYMTKEATRKAFMVKKITKKIKGSVEAYLLASVSEYKDYLEGNCYMYVVKDKDGEELHSCGGFLGDIEYVKGQARLEAEAHEDVVKENPNQLQLPLDIV
jgi:hypothetical protein